MLNGQLFLSRTLKSDVPRFSSILWVLLCAVLLSAGSASAQQILYTVQGTALRQVLIGGGDSAVGTLAGPTEALAVHPSTGVLYYVDFPARNLYLYNRVTNSNQLIGSTGLGSTGGTGALNVRKLGFGTNGTLYLGHPVNTRDIYTVNLQTGALTFFGTIDFSFGGTPNNSRDLAVFGNTMYYQVTDGNTDLYTVNLSNAGCGTEPCLTPTLRCNNAPTSYGIGIGLNGTTLYYSTSSSSDPDVNQLIFPGSGTTCTSTLEEDIGSTVQYIGDLTNGILLSTTPVTLSHFHTSSAGSEVNFTWSTATEMANVGFHIYEVVEGNPRRLNEQLIPSRKIDSDGPLSYEFTAVSTADEFVIADVDLRGTEQRRGPYRLGESYGKLVEPELVDWASLRNEYAAKSNYAKAAGTALTKEAKRWGSRSSTGFFQQRSARLSVSRDGLHRVTYAQLRAAGVDLRGVRHDRFSLSGPDGPVAIHVGGRNPFGPGSYIDFVGAAADSLYTRTNIYTLTGKGGSLNNSARYEVLARAKASGPGVYEAKVVHQRQQEYAVHSPTADPWYDSRLLSFKSPVNRTFTFDVADLAQGVGRLEFRPLGRYGLAPHARPSRRGGTQRSRNRG